jgi:predicted nucleic acid-binding protein
MPRKSKSVVLDTWAVLAYLDGEVGGPSVANAIAEAQEGGRSLLLTAVTAAEIWLVVARATSAEEANRVMVELRTLGIEIVPVDWDLAAIAASIRTHYRLSPVAALSVALAQDRKAELLTGDSKFKQLKGEIKIQWL